MEQKIKYYKRKLKGMSFIIPNNISKMCIKESGTNDNYISKRVVEE